MFFKQFFEPDTSTFTYLLACEKTKQAVLIDTVESEVPKYLKELEAQNLKLVYTLETHVHADHVTGADSLRQKLGSKSVVHRDAGAMCGDLLVTDGVYRDWETDRKSTRLNSSHSRASRMPSSA